MSHLCGSWECIYLTFRLCVIQVEVDGVQIYDEDQIALVIPDFSHFIVPVPVILGTPTISYIINMIKEKEIDALVTPWVNTWVAHLLSVWRAAAMVEDDETAQNSNLGGYDEIVLTKNIETINDFSSHVIIAHTSETITVMTQALCIKDGSPPQDLMVQNAYTELRKGSKNVIMVLRNSLAYPQTLRKKTPIVRAVAVNQVPEPPVQTDLTGVLGEDHSHHT